MTTALIKFEKVGQHQYKCSDWKLIGIANKSNPTRQLHIVYYVKHQGKVCSNFKGGSLSQAKQFVRSQL